MSLWKWLFGLKPSEPENIASSKPPQAQGFFDGGFLHKGDIKSWDKQYGHKYVIDVSKDGIRVDGALLSDMTVVAFARVFGEPRIVKDKFSRGRRWVIWDDVGVYADIVSDAVMLDELILAIAGDEKGTSDRYPRSVFLGELTIDGKAPLDAIPDEEMKYSSLVGVEMDQWGVFLYLRDDLSESIDAMIPLDAEGSEREDEIDTAAIAKLIRAHPMPFEVIEIAWGD